MKFLIIGTGYTSEMYSKSLEFYSQEYLTSSRNPKNLSVKTYENIKELGITHALICTPIDTHYKCIDWLVSNDIKNIYCEKPFSFSNRSIPIHWLNFNIRILQNRRYYEWVNSAKSIFINEKVKSIIAFCPEKLSKNHKTLNEAILGNSIHVFDLINYLVGDVCKINFKDLNDDFAMFSYESKLCNSINVICTLDSYINTEIKVLFKNGKVLKIKPVEKAFLSTSMQIIQPSKDHPSRIYKPNNKEFYLKKENNTKIKPGFLDLIEDIIKNQDALKLPKLNEHISLLKSIDLMLTI